MVESETGEDNDPENVSMGVSGDDGRQYGG